MFNICLDLLTDNISQLHKSNNFLIYFRDFIWVIALVCGAMLILMLPVISWKLWSWHGKTSIIIIIIFILYEAGYYTRYWSISIHLSVFTIIFFSCLYLKKIIIILTISAKVVTREEATEITTDLHVSTSFRNIIQQNAK